VFNPDRQQLRQMYIDAWRKHRNHQPMQPLEAQIADVIELHPEYQAVLGNDDNVDKDWLPEGGASNPFLHMGLHLAVRDQIATDRPSGINAAYQALLHKRGSRHEAEHQLIECLAEALWSAQRSGTPPDEVAYLHKVRSLT
jgi:hypothetical protein